MPFRLEASLNFNREWPVIVSESVNAVTWLNSKLIIKFFLSKILPSDWDKKICHYLLSWIKDISSSLRLLRKRTPLRDRLFPPTTLKSNQMTKNWFFSTFPHFIANLSGAILKWGAGQKLICWDPYATCGSISGLIDQGNLIVFFFFYDLILW